MRRWIGIIAVIGLIGCASPAQDYVEADAAAWDTPQGAGIDAHVDAWIDQTPWDADATKDASIKNALHDLMKGRRARIAHAMAQFHVAPTTSATK